jgi:hypothetical protein
VTKDVTLPDSPLTRLQNVSLIRAGDSFILAGYDGVTVHWGHLTLDGVLTEEAVLRRRSQRWSGRSSARPRRQPQATSSLPS